MSSEEINTGYGRAVPIEAGPLAGFYTWGFGQDPFETLAGPFGFREEAGGSIRVAFAPEAKHLNGAGALHGGLLMTFADFALFSIAHPVLKHGVMAVTLTLNAEFVSAGSLDGLIEAEGQIVKETRSVIFIQGRLVQRDAPILAFSGVIKKIAPRAA